MQKKGKECTRTHTRYKSERKSEGAQKEKKQETNTTSPYLPYPTSMEHRVIGPRKSTNAVGGPWHHFVRVSNPASVRIQRHRTQTGTLKRHTEIALQQNTHQRHINDYHIIPNCDGVIYTQTHYHTEDSNSSK